MDFIVFVFNEVQLVHRPMTENGATHRALEIEPFAQTGFSRYFSVLERAVLELPSAAGL